MYVCIKKLEILDFGEIKTESCIVYDQFTYMMHTMITRMFAVIILMDLKRCSLSKIIFTIYFYFCFFESNLRIQFFGKC